MVGERLRSELLYFRRLANFVGSNDPHKTKMPLVLKDQALAICEMKNCVREFRQFRFRPQEHKPAAHAQMSDQGMSVVKIKKYMLSATPHASDRRTL
jgi:hypothetical protein